MAFEACWVLAGAWVVVGVHALVVVVVVGATHWVVVVVGATHSEVVVGAAETRAKSVKLREVTSRNRYAPSQVEVDEGFSQVEVVVGFSQVEVDEGFSALEDDGAVQDDDDDGAVHSLEDDDEEDGADQAEVDDDGESEPERAALAAVVSVSLAKRQSTYSVGGRSHQSRGEKERCEREQDALRSVLEPSRAA